MVSLCQTSVMCVVCGVCVCVWGGGGGGGGTGILNKSSVIETDLL